MIQTDNILNGCVISLIKPPGQSEQIIQGQHLCVRNWCTFKSIKMMSIFFGKNLIYSTTLIQRRADLRERPRGRAPLLWIKKERKARRGSKTKPLLKHPNIPSTKIWKPPRLSVTLLFLMSWTQFAIVSCIQVEYLVA